MTPLGKFSGTIEFTAENTVVQGFLSFLGMKSLFEGAFFKTQVFNEKLHEYAECVTLRSQY